MACWLAEELVERHSARPDKQSASGLESFRELVQATDVRALTPALHLDGRQRRAALQHEVHFVRLLPPVAEFDVRSGGIEQVRSDCALHQPAPERAVRLGLAEGVSRPGGHERSIEDVELRVRLFAPGGLDGVFGQSGQQSRAREQVEVMSQRGRVARILKVPDHLGV